MNENRFVRLADAVDASDDVNKKTLNGAVNLLVSDLRAENRCIDQLILATNETVNNKVLLLDGKSMPTEDINFDNNKITDFKDPTEDQDAVNKRYLDYLLIHEH